MESSQMQNVGIRAEPWAHKAHGVFGDPLTNKVNAIEIRDSFWSCPMPKSTGATLICLIVTYYMTLYTAPALHLYTDSNETSGVIK